MARAPSSRRGAAPPRRGVDSTAMTTETATLHGGRLIARRLKAHGVSKLFTLSGGHLFSIYDGCREEGIDIVDVRHESAAAFAAEGWAKVTREPGVCALTAGPGRHQRDERDRLGAAEQLADARARRPRARDALGPGVAAGDRPRAVRAAADEARRDRRVDRRDPRAGRRGAARRRARPTAARCSSTSRSTSCSSEAGRAGARAADAASGARADARALDRAAALLREAERPVIMAGTNLYWGRGEDALRGARRGARNPGLPQRPGARLPARRP